MKWSLSFVFFAALLGLIFADHFSVKNGNEICIVLDATITGKIKYEKDDSETAEYAFNVTSDSSEGRCHSAYKSISQQYLTILFRPNNITPHDQKEKQKWNLTLWFSPGKDKVFTLSDFHLDVYFYTGFFNVTDKTASYVKSKDAEIEVGAEEKNGFKCSDTGLSFADGSTISMKNLKVIAFANLNTTDFPAEQTFEQCSMDARTSDIVPIVVGACLAGLVIVVLIAYLIGRARAKRQGYASV